MSPTITKIVHDLEIMIRCYDKAPTQQQEIIRIAYDYRLKQLKERKEERLITYYQSMYEKMRLPDA